MVGGGAYAPPPFAVTELQSLVRITDRALDRAGACVPARPDLDLAGPCIDGAGRLGRPDPDMAGFGIDVEIAASHIYGVRRTGARRPARQSDGEAKD
jgi:hypothetical protein